MATLPRAARRAPLAEVWLTSYVDNVIDGNPAVAAAKPAVIVSPHFDDGVMSAARQAMCPRALLLTVFAGIPGSDCRLGDWDLLTRATSARGRQLERQAEDTAAASQLGALTARLTELDVEYRTTGVDFDRLCAAMRPFLADAGQVWLPAAIGSHPDHLLARDAGLRCLAVHGDEPQVNLYADVPYAIEYGWPSWVDPTGVLPFADADWFVESELTGAGLDAFELKPTVWELSPAERERKYLAVSAYRTQLAALRMEELLARRADCLLRFEVSWRIQVTSLSSTWC